MLEPDGFVSCPVLAPLVDARHLPRVPAVTLAAISKRADLSDEQKDDQAGIDTHRIGILGITGTAADAAAAQWKEGASTRPRGYTQGVAPLTMHCLLSRRCLGEGIGGEGA